MTTTDLRAVTRRFYDEVFTEGNLDAIDELAHDDFVEHEEMPGLPPTKEGVRLFTAAMLQAFPDLAVSVEDIIVEDNKAASRVRFSGTHRGEFMGIPPTDKKINIQVIDIMAYRDGKATDHWGVTDQMGMMVQLGVIDEPV
jgi:steroid delta-isomerase-like uncharacterized protein